MNKNAFYCFELYRWGKFLTTSGSVAGKWFAETPSDAVEWGRRFYQWSHIPFFIVRVDVPDFVAEQIYKIPNLDYISPARWAEGDLLDTINSTNNGIIELTTIPIRRAIGNL